MIGVLRSTAQRIILLLVCSGAAVSCAVEHPVVGVWPNDPTADDATPYELLLIGFGGPAGTAAAPDFAPGSAGIPAPGAALWLQADALPVVPHDTPIGVWPDSSGNGNDAANANPASQPLYIGDGSGPGGRPGLRFLQKRMDANFSTAVSATKTIYTVITDTGSSNNCCSGIIAMLGGASNQNGMIVVRTGGGARRVGLDFPSTRLLASGSVLNRPIIATGIYGVGRTEVYVDGTRLASNSSSWGRASNRYALGRRGNAARSFRGDLFEVLVYPGAQSRAEREVTQCYLSRKYGIAVSHACP